MPASAAELAAAVRSGELSAVEAVEASLRAAAEHAGLNAIVTLWAEQALARARGPLSGPLAGVPVLVKDLFDTAGERTTYGSRVYAEHVPERSAEAVLRLEAAGAVVIGKTNLYEFAWGVTSENPWYGGVHNPRHPGKTAGGSSSGSAAAVAAGIVPLALGSDTGGSIRLPSACCETVGFKPTLGRIPLAGCFPLCPSFDTAGPLARTAADCALAWSVLTGEPVPGPRLAGLTVGLLSRAPRVGPPDEESPLDERAWAWAAQLEALGARVVSVEIPGCEADSWPLFQHEALVSHAATFPSRADEYGPVVRKKLTAAQRATPEAIEAARGAIARWRAATAVEPAVDLFLSPTLGVHELPFEDVSELDIRTRFSSFTRPFNYLGWAAVALGNLQLAGRDDETVLAAALAWEAAYGIPAWP